MVIIGNIKDFVCKLLQATRLQAIELKAAIQKQSRTTQTVMLVSAFVCILLTMPISASTLFSRKDMPPSALELAQLYGAADIMEPKGSENTDSPASDVIEASEPEETTEPPEETPEPPRQMLEHLAPLYEINSDLAGWLSIPGTAVDYPVMYTPENEGFYLYRTFDKKDDPTKQGTLFIDEYSTLEPRSTNLIIYGHNMKNGTMFATLLKYKDMLFYLEHPTFEYSTLFDTQEYEIIAVFLSKIYRVSDDVFKYYQFFDAETEEEFDYFISNIKELSLYDTGVTAHFGDELITLSTCEYSQENGRLVVVGRRK